MKQNWGYVLGKQVRRFKEWDHPILLKILYLFMCLIPLYPLKPIIYAVLGLIGILALIYFLHTDYDTAFIQRKKIIKELQEIKELQRNNRC